MPDEELQEIWSYRPAGVHTIIAVGSTCFVGDLGNDQVLKYPHIAENRDAIEHEARIYDVLGNHPRILRCHGLDEAGLRLDKAANGTLRDFLKTQHSLREKLKWSRQLAEAVEYVHSKQVFHCDISLRNCFFTEKCDLQLGDFQGRYRAPDGVIHDRYSRAGAKAWLPRPPTRVDHYSDLFAVGSAIHEIMTGHEPYAHLDSIDDLEKIEALFEDRKFPSTDHILAHNVIHACWWQRYDSARQCARDVADIEAQRSRSHSLVLLVYPSVGSVVVKLTAIWIEKGSAIRVRAVHPEAIAVPIVKRAALPNAEPAPEPKPEADAEAKAEVGPRAFPASEADAPANLRIRQGEDWTPEEWLIGW